MPALVVALGAIVAWILDLFNKAPPLKFVAVLLVMIAVLAVIPWPSWLTGIGSVFSGLPPGVVYGLNVVMFPQGLAILVSAWSLRFVLRWIRAALSAS